MAFETDSLIDRRRLKRRLAFWRVAGVVALVAVVVVAFGRLGDRVRGDYVARLSVSGIILDDPAREAALDALRDDDHAQALIVRIDSPGGSVAGGEALFHALRRVAEKKPVVAVMREMATSAGYMTALGADRIHARAGSLTGSIGVIFQSANVAELLDKLGIKPQIIKSGALKGEPNPFEPMTPEVRQAMEALIADSYDLFVDMVAERRGMDRARVLELADGRVFTGRQARDIGLIDALGGEAEARAWLEDAHGIPATLSARRVEIEDGAPLWVEMIPDSIQKSLFSERLRLDGLISLWHPGNP